MHATSEAPSERLPCIWMTAGLVRWRLCDREYDCDHCPLDAALRGVTVEAEEANPSARAESWDRVPGPLEAAGAHPSARGEERRGGGGPLQAAAADPSAKGGSRGGAEGRLETGGDGSAPAESGRGRGGEGRRRAPGRGEFPADRLFGAGHTWAQVVAGGVPGRFRVGLDGFAAALLEAPRAVRCVAAGSRLAMGDAACEVDLDGGVLTLGAPLAGAVVAGNRRCQDDPALLAADPYGDGWLLELAAGTPAVPVDNAAGDGLLAAEDARRRAGHDLRRFRRRVALELLAADDGVGPTLPDGGEPVVDLRGLLGARRYLDLLRELVH